MQRDDSSAYVPIEDGEVNPFLYKPLAGSRLIDSPYARRQRKDNKRNKNVEIGSTRHVVVVKRVVEEEVDAQTLSSLSSDGTGSTRDSKPAPVQLDFTSSHAAGPSEPAALPSVYLWVLYRFHKKVERWWAYFTGGFLLFALSSTFGSATLASSFSTLSLVLASLVGGLVEDVWSFDDKLAVADRIAFAIKVDTFRSRLFSVRRFQFLFCCRLGFMFVALVTYCWTSLSFVPVFNCSCPQ